MQTHRYSFVSIVFAFGLLCVMTASVAWGQPSPGETPRVNPFRGMSYGMFGAQTTGQMESLYSPTSPFFRSFRFSSDGFFRGYDIEADETAIFRSVPPPEPVKPLTADDLRVPTPPEPSVNQRLVVPNAGTQQTPLRPFAPSPYLHSEQYQRSRMPSNIPIAVEGESTTAPNPRWFRDLGTPPRGNTQPQVLPQAIQPGVSSGAAVVGYGATPVTAPTNTQQANTPQTNSVQANTAQSLRQREQQIEISLVTNPAVHLLSPVQVRLLGSTVTLRGVVATEGQKVAAGRIVLAHPAVQEVKNLMTVVPLDPSAVPATTPIE